MMNSSKLLLQLRIWLRWLVLHGAAGVMLRRQARRGDPFAAVLVGPNRSADPYPDMERIRRRGRIVRTPLLNVSVDHEVCRTILRDKRFGTTSPTDMNLPRPVRWTLERTKGVPNPTDPPAMIGSNPPEHGRIRRHVVAALTARAMADLTDCITDVTGQLLDELESQSHAEMIGDFAARLPVAVIARLLGVPPQDEPRMLEWGDKAAALFDIGVGHASYRRGVEGLSEAREYLGEHVDKLRVQPGSSVFGHIVANSDLNRFELLATAANLMGAGFETTMNMLGNGIVLLLRHPEQLALLRSDPSLWPSAVEEILRLESAVQLTLRTAHEDVEIAGHTLRAAEVIVLLLGGANRDPRLFTEPGRFDITRENAREHLAFGHGIHVCLGARLSRLEGAIGLRMLFERFPDLTLEGEPESRGYVVLRGFGRVPVRLGPVAQGSHATTDPRIALPIP
ncbi:cytochrome P450 [Nocardia sp. CDC159]|uniref:Cytochrome P450 n=1 Tax=Nocardia pulmonis TaxID=2951408 RepID=A0A9X2EDA3_9NOCA|nr:MULTISPECIES: cytochrome P450 [Nocardia]MCM6778682.1 cytochrome P450 [Nocardia pulmonis]MCM6791571.1 cytochrome P450 [Nocardia sp. CDC159]